jgi:hypothetical protein
VWHLAPLVHNPMRGGDEGEDGKHPPKLHEEKGLWTGDGVLREIGFVAFHRPATELEVMRGYRAIHPRAERAAHLWYVNTVTFWICWAVAFWERNSAILLRSGVSCSLWRYAHLTSGYFSMNCCNLSVEARSTMSLSL